MDLWILNSCSNCVGYYDQRLMAPGRWLSDAQGDAGCFAPASPPSEAAGRTDMLARRGVYGAVCCRVSLDSAVLSLTSAAADAASARTVSVASVAVALTSSRACWAGSCRLPAISFAVSVRSSTMGCAVSFTFSAACCSTRLAGSIEDTRRPAPKAISPAAMGEPCALRATALGASDTASPTVPASCWVLSAASEALPRTASFTEVAAPRTRLTCRFAMLPGLTLSPRALTLSLSSLRIRSGSLLIKWSLIVEEAEVVRCSRFGLFVAFEGVGNFLHGVRGFRQAPHGLEGIPAHDGQDRADDAPDDSDDHRGPAQAGGRTDRPPQGDGHEQQHEIPGDRGAT